ncbi:hypothetical protein ATANTOWER_031126, partial [Ataeniobius toweri]|nr:hypothetical protein [Ataeniobius toweri]
MEEQGEGIQKERELFNLIKKRRAKLGVLTRKRNDIHVLIDAGESKLSIDEHMKTFNNYLGEFMDLQSSVQRLLSNEEKEIDHGDWYEPKLISFKEFLDEIETWMNADPDVQTGGLNSASDVANVASYDHDIGPDDSVLQTAHQTINNVSERLSGTAAKPLCKAASEAPSKASSARSKSSRAASVALIEEEVERAALKMEVD